MDEKEFEDVTKEEMQRFLIKEAQRGSTEFEAYKNLMEILGIEFPKFWSGVVLTGNPTSRACGAVAPMFIGDISAWVCVRATGSV